MTLRSVLVAVSSAGLAIGLAACASTVQRPVAGQELRASSTPSSSTARAELLARQDRLRAVARDIQDLVDPLEGPVAKPLPSGENRFAEVRINLDRDQVEVWWAGPLPREVRAILAQHPEVTTVVHRARFSNNELRAASARVAAVLRSGRLGDDVTTDAIEHDARAGRLTVHVIDPSDRWTTAELHGRLDSLTTVPLDIVRQHDATLTPL